MRKELTPEEYEEWSKLHKVIAHEDEYLDSDGYGELTKIFKDDSENKHWKVYYIGIGTGMYGCFKDRVYIDQKTNKVQLIEVVPYPVTITRYMEKD